MDFLSGYKTYIAAAGLLALAIYQLTTGDYMAAYTSFMAALAAAGLRSAVAPIVAQAKAEAKAKAFQRSNNK